MILPRLLGWDIHQNDDFFLAFLVATHLATALVLFGFFFEDWKRIVGGLARSLREREIRADDPDARLGWLLVVGTIPVGLIGLLAEKPLRNVFASPASAALFLFGNGIMLLGAERLRRRVVATDSVGSDERLARLAGARRGRRHVAGHRADPGLLALGRDDERRAARGAEQRGRGALRLPARHADHRRGGAAEDPRPARSRPATACAGRRRRRLCAAVTTYFAVKFLLRFFETNRLTPFGIYCLVVGGLLTIGFAAGL